MFPKPKPSLTPNTYAYESEPLVKPTGFRANRPLTFGPEEMTRLKEIVLNARFDLRGGGSYVFVENFPARYNLGEHPIDRRQLRRPI